METRTERREKREITGLKRAVIALGVLCAALIVACVLLALRQPEEDTSFASFADENKALREEIAQLKDDVSRLKAEKAALERAAERTVGDGVLDVPPAEPETGESVGNVVPDVPQPEPEPEPVYVTVDDLNPGDTVSPEELSDISDYFVAYEIVEGDAVYERINGKSYRKNDNIALSQLRYLKMLHYNFEHEIELGEMIVNERIADDVLEIFRELFDIGYEVEKMYLIDNYWTGDGGTSDTASIDQNNTSAFCYRAATGSGNLSYHAYGLAIDLNPQQNPYLYLSGGEWRWAHENATPYVDRTSGDPHVIVKGDDCYNIFIDHGFSWGGNWSNPKDYQHFEKRS